MLIFDHFVLAAADLEAAKADFARRSGCTPVDGGAHTGLGTHNALCSFGEHSYLEIVAPDPAQDNRNPFTDHLAGLHDLTPLHWAIRNTDLPALAGRADALGMSTGPIRDTARRQPDGNVLEWQLMGLGEHNLGGLMPFFIDWKACPHPAQTSPTAGAVDHFEVTLPDGPVHNLLAGTDGVTISRGAPGIRLTVATEAGEITFTANELSGFTL